MKSLYIIMKKTLRRAVLLALCILFVLGAIGCSDASRTVMTVGGEDVPLYEYRYFFLNNKRELYGGAELSAEDISELQKMCAENVKNRHALSLLAEEYGVKLSDDDEKKLDELVSALKSNYADDEAYEAALSADFLTEELYRELNRDTLLAVATVDKMVADGAIPAKEVGVADALRLGEMACLKEIYVYYPSPETREIAQNRAAEALSRLEGGEDFEALMREYSSYSAEKLPYDSGYYTMKYDALDVVWDAAERLAVGEHSGIIESEFGFHIILRCAPDENYASEHIDELYEIYSQSKFYEKFYEIYNNLTPEFTEYGQKLDFAKISM